MKLLITGASGFIGKSLIRKLSTYPNYKVFTITRNPFVLENEKNFVFDITDTEKLRETIKEINPDTIIHLAAAGVKYGEGNLEEIFKVNSFSIVNIAEICKENSIKPKFVVAGSGFEYKLENRPLKETDCLNPLSIYGISKATQSMLLKRYAEGFTIFLLRFFSVYGVGEAKHRIFPYIISQVLEGKKVELTGCQQVRDYLYIDDVVDSIVEFIKKDEDKGFYDFNVASGKGYILKDIVEIIAEKLKKLGYNPDIEFGALPYRKDEPMYYVADISKITKYLEWEPKVSIDEGIEKLIREYIK